MQVVKAAVEVVQVDVVVAVTVVVVVVVEYVYVNRGRINDVKPNRRPSGTVGDRPIEPKMG